MKTKETTQTQFLFIQDIDWIGQFVDKTRKSWILGVKATLKNISSIYQLPTIEIKSKNYSSGFVTAFSIEAINILKEKMEQNPENFINGRMIR